MIARRFRASIVVVTLALDTLKLGAITAPISNMLNQILLAIPNIFAAILLMILAYVAAKLLAGVVAVSYTHLTLPTIYSV